MQFKYIYILLLLIATFPVFGQEDKGGRSNAPIKESLEEVSKAIEKGASDEEVAANYESLAKNLMANADYTRAEEYLNRARKLYEKTKNKDKIAAIDRELAKAQEAQNNFTAAVNSLNNAQINTRDKKMRQVNAIDIKRVSNQNNPIAQSRYIQDKIDVLEQTDDSEEKALAYQQLAGAYKDMDDAPKAIESLEIALERSKSQPIVAQQIKQEIANVYVAENQLDKAIEINESLLAEAKITNNTHEEIKQLQNISNTYIEADRPMDGILALQEAYNLAIMNSQTLDAKNSLQLLVEQYQRLRQPQKALELYADFITKLENLVTTDNTLVDDKLFLVQEEKIVQLEKERALKDALIEKQNKFNYVLIGVIVLALIFLVFIAKALYSIKKKNKRIALQSLRREMNPHFIFNSLNSVNQFIAQNNELEANKYLSSYSKLMRNIMENSNKDFISLSTEIEQLKEYLDLEHLRFHDKFAYNINVDETLDTDAIFIPNMLIQPQLENAIWHGLRYKEQKGLLQLNIKQSGNKLIINVDDNGIGLTKSQELKTKHQKEHRSRGLTNTQERISLLNSLYNTDITIDIVEKDKEDTGVIVTLQIPLMQHKR